MGIDRLKLIKPIGSETYPTEDRLNKSVDYLHLYLISVNY